MVGKLIRDYMEGGAKKLTVPGFGTFMRREGGEVIFVDLLRGDDHTLSEMVEDRGGYSEVEAMALIDRFIFETRDAIERTGSATIEGLGTMTLDHKGVYQFRHSPKSRPAPERAVQEKLFDGEDTPGLPPVEASGDEVPRRTPKAPEVPPARPSTAPAPRNPVPGRPARPPQSGKPRRSEPQAEKPRRRKPQGGKRSRSDIILIVAIAAAVIAIAAMAIGLSWSGDMPFMSE